MVYVSSVCVHKLLFHKINRGEQDASLSKYRKGDSVQ